MRFVDCCEMLDRISKTPKRLEKTDLVVELLQKTPKKDLPTVMMLLKGRVFPEWDDHQLGVSDKLVIKAIALASGESEAVVVQQLKKIGDLGEVAGKLLNKKKQHTLTSSELTVSDVAQTIKKLALLEGTGSVDQKLKLIAQLYGNATPLESQFISRILLEDLRIGIADGTIRDAIILYAGEKTEEWIGAVQDAIDCSNDVARVAIVAKEDGVAGLKKIGLTIGSPIKVMLAQRESAITDALNRVGRPAAVEFKYDGFRMQIHKKDDHVTLFTRRLENVTVQFPEVVDLVRLSIKEDCILDAEAVGFDPKTKKYRPFQDVSQRIRRKYDIIGLAKELPVEINVFDILQIDGRAMYLQPFHERRAILEKIIPHKKLQLLPSHLRIVSDDDGANAVYQESLAAGNEGIMVKTLDAPYKPGSRVGFMVKLKPVLDAYDVVIIGAEWGEGKRSGWLTSFMFACLGEDGEFLELGRLGTGLKELEQDGGTTFDQLTELLKPHIIAESGKEVKIRPKVVIEVKCEEIQKSPSYSSGYALRFPRFVRLRDDRRPDEITTIDEIQEVYAHQRGRS